MSKKPFIVQDPVMQEYDNRIGDLIDRIDGLIANPDPAALDQFIADVRAMKRDLHAELLARNPPEGWGKLEQKTTALLQ